MQTVRMIGRATCINFVDEREKRESNNKETTKMRKHETDERERKEFSVTPKYSGCKFAREKKKHENENKNLAHLWLIEYENPDQYRSAPGL